MLTDEDRALIMRTLGCGLLQGSDETILSLPYKRVAALLQAARSEAYKQGWNDREGDLLAAADRILPDRSEAQPPKGEAVACVLDASRVELAPPPFLARSDGRGICVDACLALEVSRLWADGIRTTGSCCGHGAQQGYIGVIDADIPRMKALGYAVHANPCRPGDEDSFVPKSPCVSSPPSAQAQIADLTEERDHWKRIAEDRLSSANQQLMRARKAEAQIDRLREALLSIDGSLSYAENDANAEADTSEDVWAKINVSSLRRVVDALLAALATEGREDG